MNNGYVEIMQSPNAEDLPLPVYQTDGAAGMDLRAAVGLEGFCLGAGDWGLVPTGISLKIPEGYEVQIRPRSGLAAKSGITVLNAPGTIDWDYVGEIQVILINHSRVPYLIHRGDRIAQMVLAPVTRAQWLQVTSLPYTKRGTGGGGSTGR
jgi:dUTP pyrophosphatase